MSKKTMLYQCSCYLFCNYELLEKNSYQIAEECGVSGITIRRWLRKFNIRIRTRSEAMIGKKNPNYGRTGNKHPMYGKHWSWSEESKDKIKDENHPNWRKDSNIKYGAIHKRIRKQKPKPVDGKCEICHKIIDKYGKTKLVLSNLKEHNYTLNPDDYQYVHHSCHISYDNKKRKERKTKISKAKISKNTNQVSYWLKIDKEN